MLKFPKVPEDLTGVDLEPLKTGIRKTLAVVKGGAVDLSDADKAQVKEYVAKGTGHLARVAAEEDRRQAAAAEDDELDAEIDAALEEPSPVASDAADDGVDDETEEVEDGVEEDEDEDGEETVAAATAPAKVPAVTRPRGTGAATSVKEKVKPSALRVADGVSGHAPGTEFASFTDLAASMMDRFGTMGNSTERVPVAKVKGAWPAERKLSDISTFNLDGFQENELEAALCAPCTPYYGLACLNTDRRPVFASLPGFEAPRGCVTVMASPSLSDIDSTAYGTWTFADDDNPNAVKGPCQVIECTDPSSYQLYGIYRCLTVKNLLQMTYPELVEAYLNRLAAATARYAEIQLLDAMGSHANNIQAPPMGYSANSSIMSQLLTYFAAVQERERWDISTAEMWAPRWLLAALRVDGMRRKNITGGLPSIPSEAQINAQFTGIGITPHWTLDTPTWGVPAPVQPNRGGNLVGFPSSVNVLLAPRGKFALIDRGELTIGVTGNNIYRDIDALLHNEFTMFWETFEGVVNTTSCPADLVHLPLCLSGAQVADAVSTCTGINDDMLNDAS